jgi:VanZ family protein
VVDLVGRKFVHAGEYALLCFLWWRALRRVIPEHAAVLALVIAFAYACTDEFHQTFIHGRHGTPVDVAIDMVGAVAVTIALRRRRARAGGGA